MKEFKHKCDLQLLMCEPNPLRPDRVTVGFVLRDLNCDPPRVEVRIAKDLRAVRCIYPDADIDAIQETLYYLKPLLETVTDVERHFDHLPSEFPVDLSLISKGAVLTDSIEQELALLEKQYVHSFEVADPPETRVAKNADYGRAFLLRRMNEEFRSALLLNRLDEEIPVADYTFKGDPLRIDFGFRLKESAPYTFLHAVSLVSNLERTKNVIHSWDDLQRGIQRRDSVSPEFVAIVEKEKYWQSEQAMALRAWMTDVGMQVQPETRMAQVSHDIRTSLNL